jgi:putative FmdB family regulatory protein
MPLYEYECEAAGHRFEVIQKFSDAPIEKCRVCGAPVHKLQSAPAFHLKGTGWYATDYAKSGSTPESKSGKDGKDGKDGGKKAEGADTKTSEKPAASSDSTPAASTAPAPKPETKT